jgi:RHS repeat-associated protein
MSGTGAVTSSFRYRAYGEIAQFSGAASPNILGYAGQVLDSSGLYYMRARWYDPASGRFVSRDSVNGDPSTPITLNLYAYAHLTPLLLSDPSGLGVPNGNGGPSDFLRWVLVGPGESTNRDDTQIVTRASGLLGGIVRAVGGFGDNTITFSQYLIVSTSRPPERTIQHEFGHVAQGREFGPMYIPLSIIELIFVPGIKFGAALNGQDLSWHDAHPMERDANFRAHLPDPWKH